MRIGPSPDNQQTRMEELDCAMCWTRVGLRSKVKSLFSRYPLQFSLHNNNHYNNLYSCPTIQSPCLAQVTLHKWVLKQCFSCYLYLVKLSQHQESKCPQDRCNDRCFLPLVSGATRHVRQTRRVWYNQLNINVFCQTSSSSRMDETARKGPAVRRLKRLRRTITEEFSQNSAAAGCHCIANSATASGHDHHVPYHGMYNRYTISNGTHYLQYRSSDCKPIYSTCRSD